MKGIDDGSFINLIKPFFNLSYKELFMEFSTIAFVSGKVILGAYFMIKAVNFLRGYYIEETGKLKKALKYVTAITLAVSSIAILAGAYADLAVSAISIYLIFANSYLYDFWNYEENREAVKAQFFKNAAILGALMMLYSADWTVYGLGLTLGIF